MPDVTIPAPVRAESAGLGRRALALVIDWFASMLVARLVFTEIPYLTNAFSFVNLAVFYVEVIAFTWLVGGSFGQLIVRIRVEGVDGSRLSLWRIMLRTLLICLVIPAVVFDPDGRGLHDRAVGSIVVRFPTAQATG